MRTPTQSRVMERDHYRCVLCNGHATEVHEVIPRSRKKDWDREDNQVSLCRQCHTKVHNNMRLYVRELKELLNEQYSTTGLHSEDEVCPTQHSQPE